MPWSSKCRIVLVDDFQPWRTWVCSILQTHKAIQVVGEAADGSEAVQKTEELRPDLILLDIGLPALNGIDAAARIQASAPSTKIIFLTQDNDADVVRAVLSNGAMGYVVKLDAATELFPAIEAVIAGNRFVSSSTAVI